MSLMPLGLGGMHCQHDARPSTAQDLKFYRLQGRGDMHGKEGLQQHFADMAFFSRARTTGRMGEVVDKLKANLRYITCYGGVMLQANSSAVLCKHAALLCLSFQHCELYHWMPP